MDGEGSRLRFLGLGLGAASSTNSGSEAGGREVGVEVATGVEVSGGVGSLVSEGDGAFNSCAKVSTASV